MFVRITSTTRGVGCLGGMAGGAVKLLVLEEVIGAGGTALPLSRLRAPFCMELAMRDGERGRAGGLGARAA